MFVNKTYPFSRVRGTDLHFNLVLVVVSVSDLRISQFRYHILWWWLWWWRETHRFHAYGTFREINNSLLSDCCYVREHTQETCGQSKFTAFCFADQSESHACQTCFLLREEDAHRTYGTSLVVNCGKLQWNPFSLTHVNYQIRSKLYLLNYLSLAVFLNSKQ